MSALQPIFVRGKGMRLFDEAGMPWIDCASGTFNVPLGYNDPAIQRKLQEHLSLPFLSSTFVAERSGTIIDKLCDLAPGEMTRGRVRDITGTSANEGAIKAAQKASGKSDVFSFFMSHHGQSSWMTAISGNAYRRRDVAAARSSHSTKVPAPYCYRCHYRAKYPDCGFLCVEAIHDHIQYASNGSIACFIVEPILGNGGNIVPPPGYFKQLRKLCDELDICLIADEVQTGVGRTGYFFGSEAVGLVPNMLVAAKGLGGVGIPVAAVIYEEKYDILEGHEHSSTGAGGILGLEAASHTIEHISNPEVLTEIRRLGGLLGSGLRRLADRYDYVGDVRGTGMMWGIEIVDEDGREDSEFTQSIIARAFVDHRMILRVSRPPDRGNVIKIRPPLNIGEDDIEEILETLDAVFEEASALAI